MRDGALVGALTLVVAPAAWACGEALRETTERVQNARYEIVFAPVPAPIATSAHFSLNIAVCPRDGAELPVDRNTIGPENARLQRWFGWDGAGDSLWAQSLRRMLDSREMGSDLAGIAGAVRADTDLRRHDHATFGELPPPDDETAAGT